MSPFSWRCQNFCLLSLAFIIDWRVVTNDWAKLVFSDQLNHLEYLFSRSQCEVDEAIRLYETNKEAELTVHVFPGTPAAPGMPCQGEDKSIYRRGARRWRKIYKINGHTFQVWPPMPFSPGKKKLDRAIILYQGGHCSQIA